MNSALPAFAFDYARRAGLSIFFMLFLVIAAPITFAWYLDASIPGRLVNAQHPDFQTMQPGTVLLLMVFFAVSVVPPLIQNRQRLFVLPVSNATIGTWQMVISCGCVLLCYATTVLAYESYFHLGWSHLPPILLLLGISSLVTAAAWRLAPVMDAEKASQDLLGLSYIDIALFLLKQGLILSPLVGLMLLWFWWHLDRNAVSGWHLLPALDIALAALTVGTSWALLVHEVGIQRQGESRPIEAWSERSHTFGLRRRLTSPSWNDVQTATQWLLWHSSRPYALTAAIVFMLLLLVPGICVMVAVLHSQEEFKPYLLICLYTAPATAIILGLMLEHQLDPSRRTGLRTFLATHRISDLELGKQVFRNALHLYTYYWALLLVLPATLIVVAVPLSGLTHRTDPFQLRELLDTAWRTPEIPLLCCFWSWAIGWSITGAITGLGRRVLGGIVLASLAVASIPRLVYGLPQVSDYLPEVCYYLDRISPIILISLPVLLSLSSYIQAKRRQLLSNRTVVCCLIIWVVSSILSSLVVIRQADMTDPGVVLGFICILSLSSAIILPRAAIPVMIQKRRHQ